MNYWKIATICLLAVVIVESLFIGWAWNEGSKAMEGEAECDYYCYDKNYVGYQYNPQTDVCYCYTDEGLDWYGVIE